MKVFIDLWWYFKKEKISYGLGVLILFAVSILTLVPPYIVGVIVDQIELDALTGEQLVRWLVFLFIIGIATYVLRYIWRLLIFGASIRLARLLRNQLYEHFTNMSRRFYQRKRTGDLMAHSTNDIKAIEQTAGVGVLTLVDSLTMGGMVIVTMAATINWKLTLICLIPMPFMALSTSYYGFLLHKRFAIAQAAFSSLNDKVQESMTGIRVTKAFGHEQEEIAAFRKKSDDVVKKNIAVARVDALFDPTITFIVGISFFLAVFFGARYVIADEMTLGQLTSFTIYLGLLIWPMLAFGWLFNIVERGRASYERVSSLLRIEADIIEEENAYTHLPKGNISYQIQQFSYEEGTNATLKNIQFSIKQGKTLGVVGRTGSGKSTLLKLLMREFDLSEGKVLIDGKSVTAYSFDVLRQTIGYVPQDHFLFSATIADNIAFAKPNASLQEIIEVSKLACIHEDIIRFPEGYETIVGERGVTLSGGQKQRISIARALILEPEILILDDSLSAVDAKTEEGILNALRKNRKNKTTLITAHRLSAIKHADLIIVLDEGTIREQGTHEELMLANGWYRRMYEQQQLETVVRQGGDSSGA